MTICLPTSTLPVHLRDGAALLRSAAAVGKHMFPEVLLAKLRDFLNH